MKNYDDYKDRIRYLISRLYEPADINNFDVKMSTPAIYNDLCTVIPANAFDQFDLVEVLESMGFEPQYETKKEIITRELEGQFDEKGNPVTEKDVEEYDDLRYYWYMKKKS